MNRKERKQLFQEAKASLLQSVEQHLKHGEDIKREVMLEDLHRVYGDGLLTLSWLNSVLTRFLSKSTEKLEKERSVEEWQAIFPRYPVDEDGYAISFAPNEEKLYKSWLKKYGFVVVRVLDKQACEESIEGFFEEMNSIPKTERVRPVERDKPWTWERDNWPGSSKFLVSRPALHQKAFDNRTHEVVYDVFRKIWDQDALMVNIDRWGVARGTKDLAFPQDDGTVRRQDRPDWSFEVTKHWDYNPWLFVKEMAEGLDPGYQGMLSFVDQGLDTGCHLSLPGCLPFLEQWCKERHNKLGSRRKSCRPKKGDPILDYMQALPVRQGHLFIWSWGQLHACVPNQSEKMRLHQFIGMFPAEEVNPHYTQHENFAAPKILRRYQESFCVDDIELSDLGKKLLGLETWF